MLIKPQRKLLMPTRRRFLAGAAGLVAAPAIARADMLLTGAGGSKSSAAAYNGPGDVVAGAFAWWGLRAYNAASVGGNVCDIKRASDSTTQTFVSLSNGSLDVASIATFLTATTGLITKLYDQSGGGLHVTGAGIPITLNDNGSLPAISVSAATHILVSGNLGSSKAQPYSASTVAVRDSGAGAEVTYYDEQPQEFGWSNSADTLQFYVGGGTPTAAATDGTRHAVQWVVNNASSHIYVDGSDNAVAAGTTAALDSGFPFKVGTVSASRVYRIYEAGWWPGAFTGTQATNLTSNQRAYWNF